MQLIPFFGYMNPRWKHRIHHRCRSSIFLLLIVRFYVSHSPFAWCSFSRRRRWFLCFYFRFHCFIHSSVPSPSLHSFHYYLLLEQIVSSVCPAAMMWMSPHYEQRQTADNTNSLWDFRFVSLEMDFVQSSSAHLSYSFGQCIPTFQLIKSSPIFMHSKPVYFNSSFGREHTACWWRGGRTQNYYYKPLTSITHTLIFG